MDLSGGAQQLYPTVAVPSNDQALYPNANVAPQHSAPPVVYNSQQPQQQQLVSDLFVCFTSVVEWRQCGQVVRVPDLKSVGGGFKSRSDR